VCGERENLPHNANKIIPQISKNSFLNGPLTTIILKVIKTKPTGLLKILCCISNVSEPSPVLFSFKIMQGVTLERIPKYRMWEVGKAALSHDRSNKHDIKKRTSINVKGVGIPLDLSVVFTDMKQHTWFVNIK
jgi:hypothetical protein